jgi:hypothetical protein
LKQIGKAGKAVTKQVGKQVGKALTKIGESPDKRGHEKLFLIQNPQFAVNKKKDSEYKVPNENTFSLGLETGM